MSRSFSKPFTKFPGEPSIDVQRILIEDAYLTGPARIQVAFDRSQYGVSVKSTVTTELPSSKTTSRSIYFTLSREEAQAVADFITYKATPTAEEKFELILDEAIMNAKAACQNMKDDDACGFAWTYLTERKSDFYKYCKSQSHAEHEKRERYGSLMHSSRGTQQWTWWNPGRYMGQSVSAIEAGAKAFCAVLMKHGIQASWSSRLD